MAANWLLLPKEVWYILRPDFSRIRNGLFTAAQGSSMSKKSNTAFVIFIVLFFNLSNTAISLDKALAPCRRWMMNYGYKAFINSRLHANTR